MTIHGYVLGLLLSATVASESEIAARVGGRAITRGELMTAAASMLAEVEQQRRMCTINAERNRDAAIEARLQDWIRDALLAAEAKGRNVPSADLLKEIVPREITQADVDAFYDTVLAGSKISKEAEAPRIREYLQRQALTEATNAFYASLAAKYGAESLLEPLRSDVAAAGPARGPASAPVTIVEFSDFACPYCRGASANLESVRRQFGDRVRVVYRQFPLARIHPHARKAAEASLCADEQGLFWAMHDALFRDPSKLAVGDLKRTAAELKLDLERFNRCLDAGKYEKRVDADLDAGRKAGVEGTPTIFVNGRYVRGGVPEIAAVVQDEIDRADRKRRIQ
jgi:protein-disulfide isomerase